jgi:hypothetical protein
MDFKEKFVNPNNPKITFTGFPGDDLGNYNGAFCKTLLSDTVSGVCYLR